MKRVNFIFTLFLLFMLSTRTGAQDADSLIAGVSRKMASFSRDFNYTCLVNSKEYHMDSHWKPKTTRSIEKKLVKQGDEVYYEIIKAVEIKKNEEKDITGEIQKRNMEARQNVEEEAEKEKAETDGEDKKEGRHELKMTMDDLNPFNEERRKLYTFDMLPDTTADDQHYYRLKTTAVEPSDKLYEGVYWINADTRVIEYMILQPSKNPKLVKELKMRFRFREMDDGRWMPVKIWTHVYVNLLIKKIRVETEEVYSDYKFQDTQPKNPFYH